MSVIVANCWHTISALSKGIDLLTNTSNKHSIGGDGGSGGAGGIGGGG